MHLRHHEVRLTAMKANIPIESINPRSTTNMVKEAPDVALCREAPSPAAVTMLYKKEVAALARML